ncbi:hypothetical protein LJC64_01165 [Ruminococcaceae bacterium OttesenSCG-928-A11]|nr:hypothetical protein [Ruminococcaceae bacterium OttesenSCG-928-A11]
MELRTNHNFMEMRAMLPEEHLYAFGQSTQLAGQCGSHGRLRGDFDTTGGMFYTSWDTHRAYLVTDNFKSELDQVVNTLRQKDEFGNILKDRSSMETYCRSNQEARLPLNLSDGYGFRVDTKERTYLLRCKPAVGEYDFYLYVYKSEFLNNHVQNAARGIRFIDSRYKTLFRIADGESITITEPDGKKHTHPCRYIDETHVEVGNNLFHICEFAERMEKNGNTYIPADQAVSDYDKAKPRKGKPDMER